MTNTDSQNQNRLAFLDNLRSFIVLLVVVLHVGVAYSNGLPWWYVTDSDKSSFFDLSTCVLDSFMMPVLFFIAGYFALPSLRRRAVGAFMAAKLKRLGIPWFFGVFFLVPVMPYLYHYTRAAMPLSFWAFWNGFVKSVGDFKIVLIEPSSISNDVNLMNGFNHHHLWFISLLLFFFIGFALLYQVNAKVVKFKLKFLGTNSRKDTSIQSMWIALLSAGIVISLGVTCINYFISDLAWAGFYNVLVFQPTRFPLYLGMFVLGIYAYSKNWFTKHDLPGSIIIWFVACVILLFILLVIVFNIVEISSTTDANQIHFWLILMHGIVRTFLVLAFLGFLMSFCHRYWNRPSKINQNLAASSYDIYVVHLPIVVIFQFLFLSLNISVFLKFGLILLLSILLSYGMSHYLIRRFV